MHFVNTMICASTIPTDHLARTPQVIHPIRAVYHDSCRFNSRAKTETKHAVHLACHVLPPSLHMHTLVSPYTPVRVFGPFFYSLSSLSWTATMPSVRPSRCAHLAGNLRVCDPETVYLPRLAT
jgi:hypothetical protein